MRHSNYSAPLLSLLLSLSAFSNAFSFENDEERNTAVERVSVENAREKVQEGKAFLVCAYDDKRCKGYMLEGALTRREFERHLPDLPKDQEIIIYCS